jgi:hypothetical protein
MTSPYGPSGRNEPQAWGQQPSYGGGQAPQDGGYGQQPMTPQQVPAYQNPYGPGFGESPSPHPGGYESEAAEPRGRTGLIWAVVVVAVVAIAGFVVLGYVWAPWVSGSRGFLVSTVFDSNAMDAGVASILKNDYGYSDLQASDVSCPANQAVKRSSTFNCTANIGGAPKIVAIKVTSNDGNYEVYRPQ